MTGETSPQTPSTARERKGSSGDPNREVRVLASIGRIISSSPRIAEVYEKFASTVAQLIPFDRLTIATVDVGAGLWYQAYVSGICNEGADVGTSGPLAGSITGRVIATRRGIVACGADRTGSSRRNLSCGENDTANFAR